MHQQVFSSSPFIIILIALHHVMKWGFQLIDLFIKKLLDKYFNAKYKWGFQCIESSQLKHRLLRSKVGRSPSLVPFSFQICLQRSSNNWISSVLKGSHILVLAPYNYQESFKTPSKACPNRQTINRPILFFT